MFGDSDAWLAGIGVDVQGIIGSVTGTATAVVEQATGAVTSAAAAITDGALSSNPAAPPAKPAAKPAAPTGAPPANGASALSLQGSVGAGGKNNPEDVKAVQSALKIAADGNCSPATIEAIKSFQKSIGQANPDGRVDVGGKTSRALASGVSASPPPSPAPSPTTSAATDAPGTSEEESGVFDRLQSLGENFVKGLAGDASQLISGVSDGSGGASPALNSSFGISVPKLSLDHLTKEQIEAAKRYLDAHLTAEWQGFGSLEDPASYGVALDGKNATVDEIVEVLKAEIPSRVLQNPTAELKELVQARIKELVGPLVGAAIKAAQERRKLPGGANVFAPTTLIAKAGKGRVKLLWKAIAGAKSYNIYRSEVSGNITGRPLKIVTATAFTDTGVSNGTTYFYHITAITDAGESGSSPEASGTPQVTEGPEGEAELDPLKGEVVTKVKWNVAFMAHDDHAIVQKLPGGEIEVEVDEAGNASSVEIQLNVIKARIEGNLRLVGKVEIEATAALVSKGKLGESIFKSVEAEVKGEVEVKLKHIALKASATVNPDGHVEPGFAIVLWRF